ncbi:MAG TPA: flagellar motor protein MotA [Beijerinckiaceae bacterium]|nr:flagellar motor protein MotA [Beijerinckiaceae bacterium]
MAADRDPYRLSSPRIYLVRIVVFLILIGFVALILYRQIALAYMANPGLNSLILGVLFIGILLALRQVWRLFREVRWVNALRKGDTSQVAPPILLAPMATMLGDRVAGRVISTVTLRAILDSIGTRLDESREIARYLTGLLVFLGLLGTFWGLLATVGSIGNVIKSMQGGSDAGVMFDSLKNGLAAPIAGMSISFTSSLFGLAGSLVLGFLDLQAGQAQNRFYTELEDALSANAADPLLEDGAPLAALPDLRNAIERLSVGGSDSANARAAATAMANLAEGIQGLVQHMRSEQQLIRDWVEAQADQQKEIKQFLARLAAESERQ